MRPLRRTSPLFPYTTLFRSSLLADSRTPPTVLTEAACALGKIKTAAAREVLARFLARASAGPRTNDAIGEALLSRSEEHTSELQSHVNLVCRLLLEKKKKSQ